MREYGLIASRFWLNADLKRANLASPGSRELAVYLCSSPHANGIGCYAMPVGYAVTDLSNGSGNSFETIEKGLIELQRIGFLAYCEPTQYVFIRRFLRWNPLKNENVAKARRAEFTSIPKEFSYIPVLAKELLDYGRHWGDEFAAELKQLANGWETVSESIANPDPFPLPLPDKNPLYPDLPVVNSRARAREDHPGAERVLHRQCPECSANRERDGFHVRSQFCACGWRRDPGNANGSSPARPSSTAAAAAGSGGGFSLSPEDRAAAERINAELEARRRAEPEPATGPRHVADLTGEADD